MIHHFSLPAKDPHHVATVLAEILQGTTSPFQPLDGAYTVATQDEYGTLIEIFPIGSEIMPGQGNDPAGFCRNAHPYHFSAVHAAISVPLGQAEIEAIGHREGWRVLRCEREGLFPVIEFWLENRLMLELLPPTLVRDYLQAVKPN